MSTSIANNIVLNKLPKHALNRLTKRITIAVNERVAPSVTMAIFQHDRLILNAAWGWIDPDERTLPTQADTLFDLASVTKLYTTLAFLSLLSEGKVQLDSPLMEFVPEFIEQDPRSISGGQDPHSKERLSTPDNLVGRKVNPADVTCFQLLTHTSGLPLWRDVYTVAEAPVTPPNIDPISRQERWSRAVGKLCNYPFVGFPASDVRYSDVGLMLLGEVVSRLHSQSGELDKAIKDRILKEQLSNTLFNPMYKDYRREQIAPTELDTTWRKRRVWGEVHDENANGVGGVAGHAGLFSTAFEVATFGNFWLNHTESILGINREIAHEAVQLQAQSGSEVRGLGWMLKSEKNSSAGDKFSPQSYGHTGFTGTSLWIDPEENLVVALLTNRVYAGREKIGIHDLRRDIHDIIAEIVHES